MSTQSSAKRSAAPDPATRPARLRLSVAAAYPYVISAESLDFVMSHSRSDPFEMIAQAVSSEQ